MRCVGVVVVVVVLCTFRKLVDANSFLQRIYDVFGFAGRSMEGSVFIVKGHTGRIGDVLHFDHSIPIGELTGWDADGDAVFTLYDKTIPQPSQKSHRPVYGTRCANQRRVCRAARRARRAKAARDDAPTTIDVGAESVALAKAVVRNMRR